MNFQTDSAAILWNMHFRSSPQKVFEALATDAGRAKFWAESTGWVSFVEQLRFMLEHNPRGSRKATFSNLSLSRNDVLEQLNLADEKVGTHFEGKFQDSDIMGNVWFSTPNQLGLVVDTWGPGLLILQFSEKGRITTRYS